MNDDSLPMRFLRMFLDNRDETEHVRNGILQAWAVILLTTGVIALAAWGVIYAVARLGETPGY